MSTDYTLWNLRHAAEELASIIASVESEGDEGIDAVAFGHLYHHLNTAWNAREATQDQADKCSESDFYLWRDFPTISSTISPVNPTRNSLGGSDVRRRLDGARRARRSCVDCALSSSPVAGTASTARDNRRARHFVATGLALAAIHMRTKLSRLVSSCSSMVATLETGTTPIVLPNHVVARITS